MLNALLATSEAFLMCYSAMVWQDYHAFVRKIEAKLSPVVSLNLAISLNAALAQWVFAYPTEFSEVHYEHNAARQARASRGTCRQSERDALALRRAVVTRRAPGSNGICGRRDSLTVARYTSERNSFAVGRLRGVSIHVPSLKVRFCSTAASRSNCF